MLKIARKPSTDPNQEKLRQDKANWNKEVSSFIDNLIHLKKMMNGWPSKFHMERSFIKDPIPADPNTIIGSLANDFAELSQKGNAIVTEQINYSKSRKRKQPKVPGSSPAPSSNLSSQLTASTEYSLIAEGSNAFTRFFTRILNTDVIADENTRVKKYRMSLLSAAVLTFDNLGTLQREIVGSGAGSIFAASKILNKVEGNWNFITRGFAVYAASMPKVVEDAGGEILAPPTKPTEVSEPPMVPDAVVAPKEETLPPIPPEPVKNKIEEIPLNNNPVAAVLPPIEQQCIQIKSDFAGNASNFTDINFRPFIAAQKKYNTAPPEVKQTVGQNYINEYNTLIETINTKLGTIGSSLAEIWAQKNSKTASYHIEVVAQEFLHKWIGKTKHTLNPLDRTSAFRLDIYNMAETCRDTIDEIMNSLEKDMLVDELKPLIAKVSGEMLSIRELMKALDNTTKGQNFQAPFIDLLESRKLMENNLSLTKEQKDHLEKALERRQVNELANLYNKR